eukprot:1338069-Amorphochlora_amoeboformis.AAC.1
MPDSLLLTLTRTPALTALNLTIFLIHTVNVSMSKVNPNQSPNTCAEAHEESAEGEYNASKEHSLLGYVMYGCFAS